MQTLTSIIAKSYSTMSKKKNNIGVSISRFAKEYATDIKTFKVWIDIYPDLKEAFKPYINDDGTMKQRSLPPFIETLVYKTLGEP